MISALTIAGSDPTGAAGLEADLRVFQAYGVHGCAVATALTTQDSARVHAVHALDARLIRERLDVLAADIRPAAVKCGMLGNRDVVESVASFLEEHLEGVPLVIDPVLRSSSGAVLLEDDAVDAFRELLLPRATVCTPNRGEAALLLGLQEDDAGRLASALSLTGCVAVVTGGDQIEPTVSDYVGIDGEQTRFESPRRPGASPHGTGCTLSAAVTASLVLGRSAPAAVQEGLAFMQGAVARAERLGGEHGRDFCRF